MNIKKIILVVLILLLIGAGVFFFFNRQRVTDLIKGDVDFGTFFDTNPQSQNFFPTNNQNVDPIIEVPTNYIPPVLRQISFEPVSGFTSYTTTISSPVTRLNEQNLEVQENQEIDTTTIRFQERATGHIYDVYELLPNPVQVSNITAPKIYDTIFTQNKDEYIYKILDGANEQILTKKSVLSFSKKPEDMPEENFVKETTIETLDLSNTIRELVYVFEKNKIVYPITQNGSSFIFTANPDRSEEVLLKEIPFNEFTLSKINQDKVLIATKASKNIPGYAYTLDINTETFTKILGNIPGLTLKVSPDLSYAVYSQPSTTRPVTSLYDLSTQSSTPVVIDTIPSEKCVFPTIDTTKVYCFGSLFYKSAMYPDDWYKGKVSNAESLYQINLSTAEIKPIFTFIEEEFDVIKPALSEDEIMMIFQNKNDLTLWSLNMGRIE